MKTVSSIEVQNKKRGVSQKYINVEEFAAAKLKVAKESLKNVDLSILKK